MNKSTHKVEIVSVQLEPHPNADSLSIVKVFGYSVCVRTQDWQGKSMGAYVPPDSVVSTKLSEFAFLAKPNRDTERIRAKKLRGIVSMGMLIPAPEGSKLGDDVADQLQVTHYEPPLQMSTGGEDEIGPKGYYPKYDVDAMRRYLHLFKDAEPVYMSEKIHGSNFRCVYSDNRIYIGSRTRWKKEDKKSIWWRAFHNHPEIEIFCTNNPGVALYGEVYGRVQELKYGIPNDVRFAAFDILGTHHWHHVQQFVDTAKKYNLPTVPLIALDFPFDFDKIVSLSEEDSRIVGANHMSEGVVVKPMKERVNLEIGRVCLKLVSNRYLCK